MSQTTKTQPTVPTPASPTPQVIQVQLPPQQLPSQVSPSPAPAAGGGIDTFLVIVALTVLVKLLIAK